MFRLQSMAVTKLHGEEYHAFIAHSRVETAFVEGLAASLEDEGIHCSFYEKHFTPGKSLVQNICEHVAKSRKIILVISQNYLDSKWMTFEVSEAMMKSQRDETRSIIYVLYGGVNPEKIQHYLKNITYLTYPGDEHFHKKLKKQICGNFFTFS